jgi:hypothetical protein
MYPDWISKNRDKKVKSKSAKDCFPRKTNMIKRQFRRRKKKNRKKEKYITVHTMTKITISEKKIAFSPLIRCIPCT